MKRALSIVTSVLLAAGVTAAFGACKKSEKAETVPASDTAKPADTAAKPADTAAAPTEGAKPAEGAAAADPGPEPMPGAKALAEKTVAMMTEMSAAAEANKDDCGKMASAIKGIVDKNKDLMEKGKEMDKNPAAKEWFEKNYADKLMGPMMAMMPHMEKCKDNADLKAAFESLK